ncbi:hypothetical protein ACFQZ4_49080 [Catellatospora coxensis]
MSALRFSGAHGAQNFAPSGRRTAGGRCFPAGATPAAARPDGLLAARNLPAGGKVLFYLGQDSTTLADFAADVLAADPGFPRPAGVTLYTNLVGAPMSGMFQPTDYGAGRTTSRPRSPSTAAAWRWACSCPTRRRSRRSRRTRASPTRRPPRATGAGSTSS